ncbi:MAG: phosphoribosyltransferase [Chthoniobacterales bacterium]
MRRFQHRQEAGQLLALELGHYANRRDVIVLALPRGGVPVGNEIAHILNAPLDILVVRKLGVPGHEEMAMGAIATGGVRLINQPMVSALHISPESVAEVERRELAELERRERNYRGSRPQLDTSKKTVILVDDGVATGSTMQAAIASLRQRHADRIVVATPVAPPSVVEILRQLADEVVCVITPEDFRGVGQWYDDFSQTSDEEVHRLLSASVPESSDLQVLTS